MLLLAASFSSLVLAFPEAGYSVLSGMWNNAKDRMGKTNQTYLETTPPFQLTLTEYFVFLSQALEEKE